MKPQRFVLVARVGGALADLTRSHPGLTVEALPMGRRLLLTCRGPYPGDAVLAEFFGVEADALRSLGADGTRTVLLASLGHVDDLLGAAERTDAMVVPPLVWAKGDVRVTVLSPDHVAVQRVATLLGGATIQSRRYEPRTRKQAPEPGLLGPLTAGQAKALGAAVAQGYYESPRRVTTAEVANVLGVTRSTFEEHLRAAEGHVVRAMAPLVRLRTKDPTAAPEAALETFAHFSRELGLYVHLTMREGRVSAVHMDARKPRAGVPTEHPYLARILEQIAHGSDDLRDVPVELALGPFERRVVEALREIPRGTVLTYGELARRLGHPGAARAVGNALAKNPVPLLLPCHRVVPSTGGVGNYSGGEGGPTKERLLQQEGAWPRPARKGQRRLEG